MSRETTCCFTGHRVLGNDFSRERLKSRIEKLIDMGIDTFISGGALGFDTIAAEEVILSKKNHPGIKLFIYAPCKNQSEKWNASEKAKYKKLLSAADFVDMPEFDYFNGCMKERNYRMVDASSFCIAYFNGEKLRSGTAQTLRYAESEGLKIYNISTRENGARGENIE